MGIVEMDIERILSQLYFIVVLSPSYCDEGWIVCGVYQASQKMQLVFIQFFCREAINLRPNPPYFLHIFLELQFANTLIDQFFFDKNRFESTFNKLWVWVFFNFISSWVIVWQIATSVRPVILTHFFFSVYIQGLACVFVYKYTMGSKTLCCI
jgi:hypothetical protein